MDAALIHCEHLAKRYPSGGDALRDINLHIEQGEWVFLAGHSGAGKSTLLKVLGLIERPSRGLFYFNGRNSAKITGRQIALYRRQIGMVFQEGKLLNDRSVFDNVALPLIVMGVGHRDIAKRVRAALDQVELLKYENANPLRLSSGEQQRVGIARAIVHRPKLILADEPTGNLDPQLSVDVMKIFARFHAVGVTVLIATHDVELIHQFNQRVLILKDGQVVADQMANDTLSNAA